MTTAAATPPKSAPKRSKPRRRTSLFAHGEPMVWLTGGALALGILMILGLLLLVLIHGMATFWPAPVERATVRSGGAVLGQVRRDEEFEPSPEVLAALTPEQRKRAEEEMAENGGMLRRRLFRTENFELTNTHFRWVSDVLVEDLEEPEWAVLFERRTNGRFYGYPEAFLVDGESVADGPRAAWEKLREVHDEILDRQATIDAMEEDDVGTVRDRQEQARLELRQVALDHGEDSPEYAAAAAAGEKAAAKLTAEFREITAEIAKLRTENDRYAMRMKTEDGAVTTIPVDEIVRAVAPNRLGFFGKLGVYLSRWGEYLTDDPREANTAGGVFPAIFGTVLMTFIMTLLVVPFGVLAALYLREYAKKGFAVSTVRIAINNLAGVPSIVFGVFGLGFFCYLIGSGIDEVFFEAKLPTPTFGKSGLIWASLTLALLTLPVVIVATEEALAAVPGSMREGSYACGASKWQTIWRIVIPRALPGMMTGMILAIARGAGEVAPLMLVGAVKLAPDLPGEVNAIAPYVHVERSFMHLGFHIYDLGFQSPNAEAAKPMVFTTTLLLIGIVVALNIVAILIRNRLRRRFETGHF